MKLRINGMQVFWTDDYGQEFCTNASGEGVWRIDKHGVRAGQILGTTQFQTAGRSKSTIRRHIRALNN